MIRFLLSLFGRCPHVYQWPLRGIQTCGNCGACRPTSIEFPVDPRFDIPRFEPKARVATALEREAMLKAQIEVNELEGLYRR